MMADWWIVVCFRVFTSAEDDGHAPKDKGDKADANADEDVEEDEDARME